MSPIIKAKKPEGTPKKGISKLFVPTYIILSAIFILYVVYGYLQGVVYSSGLQSGQQQGYQAAITQLMEQVGTKCEPITLTVGEQKVDVINIACLQASETPTESEVTDIVEE